MPHQRWTYLNDHLAGSAAGKELAEQCAASKPGTPLGAFMQGLAGKIENEQEIVKDLLERLDGEVNPFKSVAGWLDEPSQLTSTGELGWAKVTPSKVTRSIKVSLRIAHPFQLVKFAIGPS